MCASFPPPPLNKNAKLCTETSPTTFALQLHGDEGSFEGTEFSALLTLAVEYPEAYPDEAPVVTLRARGVHAIADDSLAELHALLAGVAQDNLGTAMVFSMHAAAKEWLDGLLAAAKAHAEEAQADARRREADADIARATAGTLITAESFAAWREQYMAEVAAEKARNQAARDAKKAGRLTGTFIRR